MDNARKQKEFKYVTLHVNIASFEFQTYINLDECLISSIIIE